MQHKMNQSKDDGPINLEVNSSKCQIKSIN